MHHAIDIMVIYLKTWKASLPKENVQQLGNILLRLLLIEIFYVYLDPAVTNYFCWLFVASELAIPFKRSNFLFKQVIPMSISNLKKI